MLDIGKTLKRKADVPEWLVWLMVALLLASFLAVVLIKFRRTLV